MRMGSLSCDKLDNMFNLKKCNAYEKDCFVISRIISYVFL